MIDSGYGVRVFLVRSDALRSSGLCPGDSLTVVSSHNVKVGDWAMILNENREDHLIQYSEEHKNRRLRGKVSSLAREFQSNNENETDNKKSPPSRAKLKATRRALRNKRELLHSGL